MINILLVFKTIILKVILRHQRKEEEKILSNRSQVWLL